VVQDEIELKAIILAGGLGTRLRPLTYVMPKAMLPVGNKPILEKIIENLRSHGIQQIIIATGYLGRTIEEYFHDGARWDVSLSYTFSPPAGTAGQLKTAESLISEDFLAMNGDILVDIDIEEMMKKHKANGASVTVAVREYEYQLKYGMVEFDENSRITSWTEKPRLKGWMNMGLYLIQPKILDLIPAGKSCSLEYDVFPEAIRKGMRIYCFKSSSSYLDIGDLASLDQANVQTGTEEYEATEKG
jgi:mannose-1-phosphate guanylyltransferase